MLRLDSRGQSFSDILDESFTYSSGDELVEESGFTVDIDLPDGRLDSPQIVRTIVTVSPLDGTNDHFNVRLTSNHHSFSLGRSVTIRSINSFYFLQDKLKDLHPYVSAPSLPPRFLLFTYSHQDLCKLFAVFLQKVLSIREYLSNKTVHLLLQTNLTLNQIDLNIQGIRDDEVPSFPLKDTRNNMKIGFSDIFGSFEEQL